MVQQPSRSERSAVVIGGSMAGLLAARALSGQLNRVTLIERDRFPEGPTFRAGVPQFRHAHVLLGQGLAILERLFPGITAELRTAGAEPVEWPRDVLWLTSAGWSRRFRSDRTLLCASRELIEYAVRRRVLALPNVVVRQRSEAVSLLADGGSAAGLRLRDRETATESELQANLVVDASGRDSHATAWLEELGFGQTTESRIDPLLGYASRVYAPPAGHAADWKLMLLQPDVTCGRGGLLLPIEGGRWIVTLAGLGRDYPPTDDEGFLAFARSLRSPSLYEAIKDATPLTPIHGYRRTENQRRYFERLPRWPEGFIVLGDAACAFNPVYGQGMTVAAVEALLLARKLSEQRRRPDGNLTGFAKRFQSLVAQKDADVWLLATSEDLRYPTTEGAKADLKTRFLHRYFDRLVRVSTANATVSKAFVDVLQLEASPASLFLPRVLLPVLRGGVHGAPAPPTAVAETHAQGAVV